MRRKRVECGAADRYFAEEVRRLPGVLRVERLGHEGTGVPTFHVYLRPDDRETEYAAYEVKGQAYDRYPSSYVSVVVLEAIDAGPPTPAHDRKHRSDSHGRDQA